MGRARKHAGPCCELDGFKLVSLGLRDAQTGGPMSLVAQLSSSLCRFSPETKGGVRIDFTPANPAQGGIRRKDQFHRPHLPSHRDKRAFPMQHEVFRGGSAVHLARGIKIKEPRNGCVPQG